MPTYQTATQSGAFQALLAYARKRPGLDIRDYGDGRDGYRAYRQELRSIQKDFQRVKQLAAEATALGIGDEAITEAAKHAFSGRLEWAGSWLEAKATDPRWTVRCEGALGRDEPCNPNP